MMSGLVLPGWADESVAIALLLALLCTGCVSNDRYPKSWSPRVYSEADCPDVAGVYENTGHGSGGILFCPKCGETNDYRQCTELCSDRLVQLAEVFFGHAVSVEDHVRITQASDRSLEVSMDTESPENLRRLALDGGDYECKDGQLWLMLDRNLEVDLGGVAMSSRRLGLVKTADSSLVGEFHYEGKGVIFVAVPAWWSETHFIRWAAADHSD